MKFIKFSLWILLGLPVLLGALWLINLLVKHSFNNPNIGVIVASITIVAITIAKYIYKEIKKSNQPTNVSPLATLSTATIPFDFDKESAYIGEKSISASKSQELSKIE